MTSTSMPLHNGNDDDDGGSHPNSQYQPKSRVMSPSEQRTLGASHNFVLGDRSGMPRDATYRDQRYTTAQFPRGYDGSNDPQLLQDLSNEFAQLLNRTDLSDCFLNVGGTYMAVHRCVLAARSSTFAAVVSGSINRLDSSTRAKIGTSTENNKLIINIDNTSPEIMKQVVIFLYTAKCELHERNAYELLDAAGRYDIKSLKVHTAKFLIRIIDNNNVLPLIRAAYAYDNILIKQNCTDYFIDHAKEIMSISALWKDFAEKHPKIVSELLYWSYNKEEFRKKPPQTESSSKW